MIVFPDTILNTRGTLEGIFKATGLHKCYVLIQHELSPEHVCGGVGVDMPERDFQQAQYAILLERRGLVAIKSARRICTPILSCENALHSHSSNVNTVLF